MSVPQLIDTHVSRGSGFTTQTNDFATSAPTQSMSSPLSQAATMSSHPQPHQPHAGVFYEDFDASQRGSSILDGPVRRSTSRSSTTVAGDGMSRSNTLKKKSSVKRVGSLKRSGSKKSFNAGSIRGFGGVDGDHSDYHSFSFTPVPTTGTPTDVLANRFQAWRQLLKSLIAYFREVQNSYESRAKSLNKVHNSIANIQHPAIFMSNNGLAEATRILEAHHKRSVSEANKAKEIENDVIGALTGLRSDLSQKIKEIKSLSGDFKNSVEKEKDLTRKEVEKLQDALQHADHEDGGAVGKNDPYVVRLGVEKQVEKQIDEENYLHRVGSHALPCAGLMLTIPRLILTWRAPDANSRPSSSAKFKRRTTRWLVSSNGKPMMRMTRWRAFEVDPSRCQRTKNGTNSSPTTLTLSIPTCHSDVSRISSTPVNITRLRRRFALECSSARANI
jgi:hypothetical protein